MCACNHEMRNRENHTRQREQQHTKTLQGGPDAEIQKAETEEMARGRVTAKAIVLCTETHNSSRVTKSTDLSHTSTF